MLFIYAKNKEIKALSKEETINKKELLKKHGWAHTATINPVMWIENLHNNIDKINLRAEVESLSEIKGDLE